MSPFAAFLFVFAFVTAVKGQDCGDVGVTATVEIQFGSGSLPSNAINATDLAGPLTLSCSVVLTVSPPATAPTLTTYKWFLNDVLLSSVSPTIILESVESSDGGLYTCLAFTSACTTQSSPAFILNTKPEFIISPDDPIIMVTEGDAFDLTCEAIGWPLPTVQWSRGSVTVAQVGGPITYSDSSASRSDAGSYNCTATNLLGSETVSRSVIVMAVDLPTTDSMMVNTTLEGNTGIDPIIGFSIAVGVTALVSLSLTLLCCIITVSINIRRKAPKKPDIHEDWPDGKEQQEEGRRAVGVDVQGLVADQDERKIAASPSEVGNIV